MTSSAHTDTPLLLALRRLRTNMTVRDRAVAEAANLRESDLTVLEVLHREGPRTPTALAQRTNTHLATMTGVLTRLEREGWIERRRDAADRRSVRVHATGVERFNALYADSAGRLAAVFERWPAERAQTFLDSVDELSRALEASPEDTGTGEPRG